MLRRFLVERHIRGIGTWAAADLAETARRANAALAKLSGVQWQQSFVARDRSFCIYLADSEAVIREHARFAGLPIERIVEIPTLFDPTSELRCARPRAGLASAPAAVTD